MTARPSSKAETRQSWSVQLGAANAKANSAPAAAGEGLPCRCRCALLPLQLRLASPPSSAPPLPRPHLLTPQPFRYRRHPPLLHRRRHVVRIAAARPSPQPPPSASLTSSSLPLRSLSPWSAHHAHPPAQIPQRCETRTLHRRALGPSTAALYTASPSEPPRPPLSALPLGSPHLSPLVTDVVSEYVVTESDGCVTRART